MKKKKPSKKKTLPKKKKIFPYKYFARVGLLPGFPMHYLEVPKILLDQLEKPWPRLLCSIGKNEAFHCGIISIKGGLGAIMIAKKRLKEVPGVSIGTNVQILLEMDKSEFGMPMPSELEEVLAQDEEAKRRFFALTPGKKRNILHFINSVKNSDLRIDKALWLMENLKLLPEGKEPMGKIMRPPKRSLQRF